MAQIGNNNISLHAVRAILGESSRSLVSLCQSSKINKWSKKSPIAIAGGKWTSPTTTLNNAHTQGEWSWMQNALTAYRLGDFREYTDVEVKPFTCTFPDELFKNSANRQFGSTDTPIGGNTVSITEVGNLKEVLQLGGAIYKCLVIVNISRSSTVYTTYLDNVDLSSFATWQLGDSIRVAYCLTDKQHVITDLGTAANFFSIKCTAYDMVTKTYVLSNPSRPWDVINAPTVVQTGSYAMFTNPALGGLGFKFTIKGNTNAGFAENSYATFAISVYEKRGTNIGTVLQLGTVADNGVINGAIGLPYHNKEVQNIFLSYGYLDNIMLRVEQVGKSWVSDMPLMQIIS